MICIYYLLTVLSDKMYDKREIKRLCMPCELIAQITAGLEMEIKKHTVKQCAFGRGDRI